MNNKGFIRQKSLLSLIGFSGPTLWRKVKAGTFPKPVKLGEKMTAWRYEDIEAWMEAQK
jgi:prophage regulatory protein